MKIRNGFVSNSSSSSFILSKQSLDNDIIKKVKNKLKKEFFNISETKDFLFGYALMDNLGLKEYFQKLKIKEFEYHIADHVGWVVQDFIKGVIERYEN